jgi:acetone carboxylase gamma subunit
MTKVFSEVRNNETLFTALRLLQHVQSEDPVSRPTIYDRLVSVAVICKKVKCQDAYSLNSSQEEWLYDVAWV